MFLVKRQIYKAGETLRTVLELKANELAQYLPLSTLTLLEIEDVGKLFFNSLTGTFNLTVSGTERLNNNNQKEFEKSNSNLFEINSYISYDAKRIESWMRMENRPDEPKEFDDKILNSDEITAHVSKFDDLVEKGSTKLSEAIYRARLTTFWLSWQKAALVSGINFDYLQTLSDVRAIRFYELTKLWRVPMIAKEGESLPDKLEIDYEKFTLLMPLPKFTSEYEINRQIRQLIKPLKSSGYIKSFRIKPDPRLIGSRHTQLIFRFSDL